MIENDVLRQLSAEKIRLLLETDKQFLEYSTYKKEELLVYIELLKEFDRFCENLKTNPEFRILKKVFVPKSDSPFADDPCFPDYSDPDYHNNEFSHSLNKMFELETFFKTNKNKPAIDSKSWKDLEQRLEEMMLLTREVIHPVIIQLSEDVNGNRFVPLFNQRYYFSEKMCAIEFLNTFLFFDERDLFWDRIYNAVGDYLF